ncbi:MAG: riboflavin synthase [Methanomassiliicoccales archaeon]
MLDVEESNSNRRIGVNFGGKGIRFRIGESVSINGVCLSVASTRNGSAYFDVIAETLRKTNLGSLKEGDRVNYERSMRLNDLIGGHLVTGHVDGTGIIRKVEEEGISRRINIRTSGEIASQILEKGLIAVDGISLTPANVTRTSFDLYIIPETMRKTTIASRKTGDKLNIELDLFGKYIRRYVSILLNHRP